MNAGRVRAALCRGFLSAFGVSLVTAFMVWMKDQGRSSSYYGYRSSPDYLQPMLAGGFLGSAAAGVALIETLIARRKLTLRRQAEVFFIALVGAYGLLIFMGFNALYTLSLIEKTPLRALERASKDIFSGEFLLLLLPLAVPHATLVLARRRVPGFLRRLEITALVAVVPTFLLSLAFRPDELERSLWPASLAYCFVLVWSADRGDSLERRIAGWVGVDEGPELACGCAEVGAGAAFVPVKGINCASCETVVAKKLAPLEGLLDVRPSASRRGVTLGVAPRGSVRLSDIRAALVGTSFEIDEDAAIHGDVAVVALPPEGGASEVDKVGAALGGLAAQSSRGVLGVSFAVHLGHEGASGVKKLRETVEQSGYRFKDVELQAP